MLQRFFCGGKLPNINITASAGKNGFKGCCSISIYTLLYMLIYQTNENEEKKFSSRLEVTSHDLFILTIY